MRTSWRAARNACGHAIVLGAGRRTAPGARRARRRLPLLTPHFSHRHALFLSIPSCVSTEHHRRCRLRCLCSFLLSSPPTMPPCHRPTSAAERQHRLSPPTSPTSLSLSTVPAIHRRDLPSLPPSPFPPPSTIEPLSPSSFVTVTVLFSSHLLTSVATLPISSSSLRLHRLPLPLHLLRLHRAPPALSHRPLPCFPSLLCLSLAELHPGDSPASPSSSLLRFGLCPSTPVTKTEHHRRPPAPSSPHHRLFAPTSPPSSQPSIVPALHRHSPPPSPPPSSSPLCCRAPPPLPCFSTPATITLLSGSIICKLPLPPFASPSPNIVGRLLRCLLSSSSLFIHRRRPLSSWSRRCPGQAPSPQATVASVAAVAPAPSSPCRRRLPSSFLPSFPRPSSAASTAVADHGRHLSSFHRRHPPLVPASAASVASFLPNFAVISSPEFLVFGWVGEDLGRWI